MIKKLSQMQIRPKQEDGTKNPLYRTDTIFRYISHLENLIQEMERKEKHQIREFQVLQRKIKNLNRKLDRIQKPRKIKDPKPSKIVEISEGVKVMQTA